MQGERRRVHDRGAASIRLVAVEAHDHVSVACAGTVASDDQGAEVSA
jgi:hypothetical protein